MVPVNLRPPAEADQLGNRFGLIYRVLPIGERDPGGRWRSVVDRAEMTRLGEGLAPGGAISEAALERTAVAIAGMVDEAKRLGVRAIAAVGTAGLRIASNGDDVVAAIRARRKGLPPSDHVLGEGEIVEQLGRASAEDFGLGQEIPWIERLLEARDPLQLEDTIEQILWDYLDEQTTQVYFDFEVILAYLLKLQLLEKRLALSEERGMEIVRHLEGV